MLITISKSDFDINDSTSIYTFNEKLRKIFEPFEVKFDFPITKIPEYLFANTNLAKINLPDSVTEIEEGAFYFCYFLKEINLPSSLTKISNAAFAECHLLFQTILPDSIKSLDTYAFGTCYPLSRQIILPFSKDYFLSNVENAQKFYNIYKDSISFKDKTLDELLTKNNSIEQIITNLEPEH